MENNSQPLLVTKKQTDPAKSPPIIQRPVTLTDYEWDKFKASSQQFVVTYKPTIEVFESLAEALNSIPRLHYVWPKGEWYFEVQDCYGNVIAEIEITTTGSL